MTFEEIRASVEARIAELQPYVDEQAALWKAKEALDAVAPAEPIAPYGYKADGVTPRKKPAPSAKTLAKQAATRKAKKEAADAKAASEIMQPMRRRRGRGTRLNVQTVTGPTEAEMKDREVALATSE